MLKSARSVYQNTDKDHSGAPSLNGNSKQRRQQRRKFERAVAAIVAEAYT